jgi:hypothetical protein
MARTKKFPNVLMNCNNPELLVRFKKTNEKLEIIMRSLDSYL